MMKQTPIYHAYYRTFLFKNHFNYMCNSVIKKTLANYRN